MSQLAGKKVVNTRIQPGLNILKLLFDKTISQPKLILKGLFSTKIVHMPIQPSLNIYNCCLTEQFVNQNFFKWTFRHKDCAHANTAKFEYLTIAVWQHNSRTRTSESCQMGFYGTEIVNHQLKSIGIFESCPMDFLEPDSSSHAKWTFMEQWIMPNGLLWNRDCEPSIKANWNHWDMPDGLFGIRLIESR